MLTPYPSVEIRCNNSFPISLNEIQYCCNLLPFSSISSTVSILIALWAENTSKLVLFSIFLLFMSELNLLISSITSSTIWPVFISLTLESRSSWKFLRKLHKESCYICFIYYPSSHLEFCQYTLLPTVCFGLKGHAEFNLQSVYQWYQLTSSICKRFLTWWCMIKTI